jgi:hypothetical protein
MMIQLGDGKNVIFKCLSADCKVVTRKQNVFSPGTNVVI